MADRHNRAIEDEICKTLAWMRHKAGHRPVDMEKLLKVSHVTFWSWENGIAFPRALVTLRKWAEAVDAKLEIKLVIKLTGKDDTEFTF